VVVSLDMGCWSNVSVAGTAARVAGAREAFAPGKSDPDVLADQVEVGAKEFVGYMGSVVGDPPVRWFGERKFLVRRWPACCSVRCWSTASKLRGPKGCRGRLNPSYAALSIDVARSRIQSVALIPGFSFIIVATHPDGSSPHEV